MNTLNALLLRDFLLDAKVIRPVLTFQSFPSGTADATVTISRGTNRFLVISDIYIWSSIPADSVGLTVKAAGVPVAPFGAQISVMPVDQPLGTFQMSSLFENICLVFMPNEDPVEIVINRSIDASLKVYVAGQIVEEPSKKVANFRYADLAKPI